MAAPQQIIDLFNLSLAALRQLADQAGRQVPAHATKAQVIEALSDLDRGQLEQDAADLLYAGNTSITWLRLGGSGFAVEALRKAIVTLEEEDPFQGALRPTVTHVPRLVEAREWRDDKVVLTFVVRKRVQTIIQNFEIVPVFADDFFQVIVRPSIGLFEVRASHDRARTLERTWLLELAQLMDRSVSYCTISVADFYALRERLTAVLDGYKGKDTSGSIYDTLELSKAETCPDLALEEQFQEDIKDLDPLSADILFTPEGSDHQVRLKVSSNGSVWFRTVVSEAVIDGVLRALQDIGAL